MPPEVNVPQIIAGLISSVILIRGIIIDVIILTSPARKNNRARQLARLRRRPLQDYDVIYLLLVLAIYFTILMLTMRILPVCGITLSDTANRIFVLTTTLAMHITAFLTIDKLRRRHGASYSDCFGSNRISVSKSILLGAAYYLAVIPPLIIVTLAFNSILQKLNIPLEVQSVLQDFASPDEPAAIRIGLFALAVTVGPAMEELVFRGMLLPVACRFTHPAAAIIITSLLFSMIHGNIQAIMPLTILAVGLSLAYIKSGTILVPIVMHAIFNIMNLLFYSLTAGS
jgi:membrane protease YdiL (CAAX protease family)